MSCFHAFKIILLKYTNNKFQFFYINDYKSNYLLNNPFGSVAMFCTGFSMSAIFTMQYYASYMDLVINTSKFFWF